MAFLIVLVSYSNACSIYLKLSKMNLFELIFTAYDWFVYLHIGAVIWHPNFNHLYLIKS